jgi:hypothetical protein
MNVKKGALRPFSSKSVGKCFQKRAIFSAKDKKKSNAKLNKLKMQVVAKPALIVNKSPMMIESGEFD